MIDVYMLPGIDGTGVLFSPFIKTAPTWANPLVIPYDNTVQRDYEELALEVSKEVDPDKPHILLGESFSGPVAILAAAKSSKNLAGLVLCATFAVNPRPLMSLLVPTACPLRLMKWFGSRNTIRHFLVSPDAPEALVNAAEATMDLVPTELVTYRLELIRTADAVAPLSKLRCPVLYLQAIHDRLVPASSYNRIKHAKPDLVRARIDAPHLLLQMRPEEAWAAISAVAGV